MCVCIRRYVHTYINTCIHTYMQTYMYIHPYAPGFVGAGGGGGHGGSGRGGADPDGRRAGLPRALHLPSAGAGGRGLGDHHHVRRRHRARYGHLRDHLLPRTQPHQVRPT